MKSKDRILIHRIIRHAGEIRSYIAGLDADAFLQDGKTISACAFVLGQIGELAKSVDPATQAMHPDIPWKSMKGLRNRIVHEYENVDMTVLWGIVSRSIPELETKLASMLTDDEGRNPDR